MILRLRWQGVSIQIDTDELDEIDGPDLLDQMARGLVRELRRAARDARQDASQQTPTMAEILRSDALECETVARRLDKCRRELWVVP